MLATRLIRLAEMCYFLRNRLCGNAVRYGMLGWTLAMLSGRFYIVPREECEAVQDGGGLGQALVSRLQWAFPSRSQSRIPLTPIQWTFVVSRADHAFEHSHQDAVRMPEIV